jgi:transposase
LYLKVVKSKGYEYLKFVESYREGKEVKQRVIVNLGRLDVLLKNSALIEKLFNKLNNGNYFKLDDLNKNDNAIVYNYGYIIIKKIWDSYKLNDFFKKILENKKIDKNYNFIKTIFSLVINRALKSELSKLGYFNEKDYFIALNEDLKLHNIYNSLEVLESIKEELEDYLLKQSINLFNRDLTVAFFDVTTLYFESKKEDSDTTILEEDGTNIKELFNLLNFTDKKPNNYKLEYIKVDNLQTLISNAKLVKGLRKFGLSKDFKMNETQIVLSLLIDKDGIPITFEIYEGNKAETTTLLDTLDRLKKRFKLDKITIVADRGISRWLNLKEIKQRGYEYIVAIRFKKQKDLEEKILNKNNYKTISFNEEDGYYGYNEFIITQTKKVKVDNNTFQDITLTHKIISTYSDKRALKDKKDRDRAIIKLHKKLQTGTPVKKSKYIKVNTTDNNCNISYEIDFTKIEQNKQYDGFYAIASSDTYLDALEIIKIHKNIYEIENSFRDIKSSLNIRPIYHYKKERIKGHIIVSFLAYFFLKNIEYRLKNSKKIQEYLKQNNETLSINKITKAINSINCVKTDINDNQEIFIKLKHNTLASKIIDLFKIKLPKNTSTKEEFFNYLNS